MKAGVLVVIALWLLAIGGWVANVVKLVSGLGPDPITSMEIARIVGIFVAPFGAVLGWM